MAKFKVGDKVVQAAADRCGVLFDGVGTVLAVFGVDDCVTTVEFGQKSRGGNGHGASGFCWNFFDDDIDRCLVPAPAQPIPVGANPSGEEVVAEKESPKPAAPENILAEALRVTGGDRRRDYGSAKVNHDRIALFWAAWDIARHGSEEEIAAAISAIRPLAPEYAELDSARDVATKMILLKIAREANTSKRDNKVDIAGYARCLSQIDGEEGEF